MLGREQTEARKRNIAGWQGGWNGAGMENSRGKKEANECDGHIERRKENKESGRKKRIG